MDMRLPAVIVIAFLALGTPAVAQASNPVLDSNGTPVRPWYAREVCLGPERKCSTIIMSAESGEIAVFGDRITRGFDRSGRGDELVRSGPSPVASRPAPDRSDGKVVSPSGAYVAPWKEVRDCIGSAPTCPAIILNTETREVAAYDGKWMRGFGPTGNGREVQRTARSN